uniref:Uncharacterized protein n=1 Tax=Rhizophora mucronata TaxID=61149 RepID=A0A2P2KD48_RHIMU
MLEICTILYLFFDDRLYDIYVALMLKFLAVGLWSMISFNYLFVRHVLHYVYCACWLTNNHYSISDGVACVNFLF